MPDLPYSACSSYKILIAEYNLEKEFLMSPIIFFRAPVCEEIINCRGDHVRLAVRVKVYPYPESTCATWVMFACKYKSILWYALLVLKPQWYIIPLGNVYGREIDTDAKDGSD